MAVGTRWEDLILGIQRVVVKVGTTTLTGGGMHLNADRLEGLISQLIAMHRRGLSVTLVTSGAIVTGAARLGLPFRGRSIRERQALAAIGQAMLMHEYESRFARAGVIVAQMLLTAGDFDQRDAFLNARNTIEELLRYGVIPIVNENDTVATEEIRIGDNDTLSARVAALVNAQLLCILSDVNGLYTADPRTNPAAIHVDTVERLSGELDAFAQHSNVSSRIGVGGMATKLTAARIATAAGVGVVIADGAIPRVVLRVLEGDEIGTRFLPDSSPLRGRRRWIALRTRVRGRLCVDTGAALAILANKKSLLPGGLLSVEGDFEAGDLVVIVGADGTEIARGNASYNRKQLEQVMKQKEGQNRIAGPGTTEAVHRDNMVLLR